MRRFGRVAHALADPVRIYPARTESPGGLSMSDMRDAIRLLLAGGQGERLWPLTRDRAKPAVPFGGLYRIIDITLSNCINSNLRRVFVLTQYKALSLNRHIRAGWSPLAGLGEYIEVLPPQMRVSQQWYQGTADAVYQNIYSIGSERSKFVFILSGDHIYKMNYSRMLEQHCDSGADVTVATLTTPIPGPPSNSGSLRPTRIGASSASRKSPHCRKNRRITRGTATPRWESTSLI